ncbi:MAG: hypothetical protein NHF97_00350 [Flavobacteriia bacterium]|nr:hypothetical protein [Candidatus Bostrichicola ureolyticus]
MVKKKQNNYKRAIIAFYNVENLFDPIQSIDYNGSIHLSIPLNSKLTNITYKKNFKILKPLIFNNDFTINGMKKWNVKKYKIKLRNISKVISQINYYNNPPVIVGLAEIENKIVLLDLINQPCLRKYNYGIIHHNSYDHRGIDCGIIYNKQRFIPYNIKYYDIIIYGKNNNRIYTRDILLVEGKLDGEYIYLIVNHWPSPISNNSYIKRNKASKVLISIINEIQNKNKNAKIIIMGDFNDNPNNNSIKSILYKYNNIIYNPMINICSKKKGTYMFKNKWNCLDQIMLSYNLYYNIDPFQYHMDKVEIFKKPYLTIGNKELPFRTFKGNKYIGGYSDHLPVYIILKKLIKKN